MIFNRFKPANFFYGLIGLFIGIAAQVLLSANHILPAVILYILAVVLIVITFGKQAGPHTPLSTLQIIGFRQWPVSARITGGAALVFTALAFYLFTTDIHPILPWVCHLASIALCVLCVFRADKNKRQENIKNHPWARWEIAILLIIFAIAAFMRLYKIDQVPFGTWYDEANYGLNALQMLQDPGYLPVFSESAELPAHLIYLIALSFRIFGISTLSIRAVSLAFGLATVFAAYLAGREFFDRRTGFLLAFFLAVSRWDVNWSRIGMHGITVPFFELLTTALILRALRRQHLMDYTLAGLSMGFGLCFYIPFRLFPLVIGLFLLVVWLTRRDFIRSSWRGLLLFGLGVFIATVPIFQYAIFQPGAFWGRMQDTSIFGGKTALQGLQTAAHTTRQHLMMFNYEGDHNGRHNLPGEPMLDPVSGSLFILGIALSLRRIRQPASFLLVTWLLLMLVPGIFSLDFEAPQSYRAIGSLPAACLLAAVPIHAVWQKWERWTEKKYRSLFLIPLTLLLGGMAVFNFHTYFFRQARSFESWLVFSTPETIIGKEMARLGNQVDYYVSTFYFQVPTLRFLAPNVPDYQRLETYDHLPLPFNDEKDAVLFVDADRKLFFQQAKLYYPDAVFHEYKAPDGTIVLYEIILKPKDITAIQGLTASYYHSANWSGTPFLVRKETQFAFDWREDDPVPFPFSVEWQGVLDAYQYGNYHFILHTPAAAELIIDGIKIDLNGVDKPTAQVMLAKGSHAITLRTTGKEGRFELAWQPPEEEETTLSSSFLFVAPVTANGLLGQYYPNENWQAPLALAQIDPWIYFYYHNQPIPRPYTVEWSGQIHIPVGGHYIFGLESIDESWLFIDDQLLIENLIPNHYQEKELDISAGLHPIRLRFSDRTGSTHINLYWTPPDGKQEIIPQAVLFPSQGEAELSKPIPEAEAAPVPIPDPVDAVTGLAVFADLQADLLWRSGECGSAAGQLQSPQDIALDAEGNTWVADSGNQRLVKISTQGKVLFEFGSPGEGRGQFVQLFDVVVENDGSLVTLDSNSPRIVQRFDPQGNYQGSFGSDLGTYFPRGLGIDESGNLYLADTGGNRVLRLSPKGQVIQVWGDWMSSNGAGQPVSVAAAPNGRLFAADAVGGLVWELLQDGSSQSWPAFLPSDTISGSHLVIGPGGQFFLTDPEEKRVLIYSAAHQPLGQLKITASGEELFSRPTGIAISPGGVLLVSDSERCQVLAFKLPDSILK